MHSCKQVQIQRKKTFQTFKRQPNKMVKQIQTIRRQKPTNCLSLFDRFVGLALKGLNPQLTHFMLLVSFYTPWKQQGKIWYSDVIWAYRKRVLTWNVSTLLTLMFHFYTPWKHQKTFGFHLLFQKVAFSLVRTESKNYHGQPQKKKKKKKKSLFLVHDRVNFFCQSEPAGTLTIFCLWTNVQC